MIKLSFSLTDLKFRTINKYLSLIIKYSVPDYTVAMLQQVTVILSIPPYPKQWKSPILQKIKSILLLITVGITFGVGLFVISLGAKEKINIYYFLFSLSVSTWCICLVIFRCCHTDDICSQVFKNERHGRSKFFNSCCVYDFYT